MYSDATVQYADRIIRNRVQRLFGREGITKGNRQDLEQELMCDALARLARFDPSRRTVGTFIARVVESRISNILRDRRSSVRDYRRNTCSLNEEVVDDDGILVERADTIDAETVRPGRSDEDRRQLVLDVQVVIEGLPEDLRGLCVRLRTESVAEIAPATGTPRTTLYDAIRRIRIYFKAAGMDGYL
jgi:RNA polymerase sigma-70 factor (ECF subfamily)